MALNGREAIVASGPTFGGGSAITFMMYARVQAMVLIVGNPLVGRRRI